MKYELVTPPTTDLDLISLDQAKQHLRVSEAIENDYITSLISAARSHVEEWTQRAILSSEWKLYLNDFPRGNETKIDLPRPVASAVDEFVYFDGEGAQQTLAEGTDFRFEQVGIQKSFVEDLLTWPTTDPRRNNAVVISFTAGWEVAEVPPEVRQAILVTIADLYETRQSQVFGISVSATKAMHSLTSSWRVDL